jgi:selenocysteine-specific elongation factor
MPYHPPGRWAGAESPDIALMVCTAGHVDHGKTRLVRMLTGCETDRLREEQERGMTIELGFAPCRLGADLAVGIVDVPGHERLVRTMVAGVSGIGLAILVVAADDGVMPQTVEHLHILSLLGVRRGLIALTKTDLVSAEAVAQRIAELREFAKGSFLAESPICPVSLETLAGFDGFYQALEAQVAARQASRAPGLFRMPVERTFSRKGLGLIVCGIPLGGMVKVGDRLQVAPDGPVGEVKDIQCFLREAGDGGSGQCLALHVADFSKQAPLRGQVLGPPGALPAAAILHLRLHAVPGLGRALRNAEEVKFHTGTAEESGTLYLLEGGELAGGGSMLASVRLNHPVAAAAHDRFILRRASPAVTAGGGEVLGLEAGDQRPMKRDLLPRLGAYVEAMAGVDPHSPAGESRRLAHRLRTAPRRAASVAELARDLLLIPANAAERLKELAAAGTLLDLGEGCYADPSSYAEALAKAESLLQEAQGLSIGRSELRARADWPEALWARVERDLEVRGAIRRRGPRLLLTAALARLPPAEQSLLERLRQLYADTGFHSPRPDELPARLGIAAEQAEKLLRHLREEGALVQLIPTVVLTREFLCRAQDLAVAAIQRAGRLDSADFKNTIGSSRKYALAILDYLDAQGVTVRKDNMRTLHTNYRQRLLER